MTAIEDAFYGALLRGKKSGELKGVREPRAMARFLYNSFQGLTLMAKATQDRKVLDDVVRVTLSVLD
jgi:TetR/AcrR family transcriptional repressor of nem operon